MKNVIITGGAGLIDFELLKFHTRWKPKRRIDDGLREVIRWYVEEGIYTKTEA